MEVGINVNLHNKFEFEVRDAVTNELKQSAVAHNIILDSMYDRLIRRNQFMEYIHVGTGDIDEDDLDPTATSLHTSVVRRATTYDSRSGYLPNLFRRVKIQLEPAEYVGSKFSEVGLAGSTSTTSLLTHALITDSEGHPIVIEKTALDVLIIYATVYFTIGNLPAHVRLSNIGYDESIFRDSWSNNNLLYYLVTGGTTSTIDSNIILGTQGEPSLNKISNPLCGLEIDSKSVSLTHNLSERKIIFPVRRFEITEGNGHIQEISFGNSFNVSLPNMNYVGTEYNDIPLSGQNGNKKVFAIPSINIDKNTIEVKLNNTITSVELIDIPYYKKQSKCSRIADTSGISGFVSNTSAWNYYTSYKEIQILSLINDNWIVNEMRPLQTMSRFDALIPFDFPDYFLYKEETSNAYVNVIDTKNNIYTASSILIHNTDAAIRQIGQNLFAFLRVNNTSNREIYGLYTPTADPISWSRFIISDYSAVSNQFVEGCAPNKYICQFTGRSNWYKFNLTTKNFQIVSVIDRINHSKFTANSLETLIVSYGDLPGIASYHENSALEWEKNELLTSTTSTIYTDGWFVDDNTLIMLNNTVGSMWVKNSLDVWEHLLVDIPASNFRNYNGISRKDVQGFTPNKNSYCVAPNNYNSQGGYIMTKTKGSYAIKFDTPPLATDEITASYKVNGIHKTDQYILDVGAYIQFGEG